MWRKLKELIGDMRAARMLDDLEAGKYDHFLATLPPEEPLNRPKRFSDVKEFEVEEWMRGSDGQ